MRALLVEVNYQSGRRAGGVDPTDPNLQCYGWQSLPSEDGSDVEIRLVEDDRDLSEYRDAPGVRVLEGEDEIDAAIAQFIPAKEQDGRLVEPKPVSEALGADDWGSSLGDGNGLPGE